MRSEELLIVLMMGFASVLALSIIVTICCYFLSRAEERRSGEILFTGKSAVIYTLMNNAAWLFFIAWTMICFNIIGDMETHNWDTDESEKGWQALRLGAALFVSSGVSLFVLVVLWRNWTGNNEMLPRDNMFVKCYSGLNMLMLSVTVLSLGTFILFALLEAMASDRLSIEDMGDAFKFPVVMFASSLVFLAANIRVFGTCTDRPPTK